jgi:tetratricopeptide (TPR) repeat protein
VRQVADVFLSYARADAGTAQRVCRELTESGHSVWFDRELPAHRPYSDVIATELENASSVLVLWSNASVQSQWVRSEANRARELGKLVQARLDDARLPMPFDQIQCGDLEKWRGRRSHAGWSQVLLSITALTGAPREIAPARPDISRRGIVVGGIVVAAVAAGGWYWQHERATDRLSPEATLLLQKGNDALQNNDVFAADDAGSLANAIALLSEATQAAPQSGSAWGSLALAYAALKRVSPGAQRPGLDARSRSAAATALRLKRFEPRATSALLLLEPLYRHWRSAESADRAAIKHTPPIPLLYFLLSETLGSVGRWKEAAAVSVLADRKRFIIPGADRRVVVDLWAAGNLQGADEALKLAVDHWPQQPQVWRTRLAYLMYSGRPSDALAILHNEAERPPNTPDKLVRSIESVAKALAGEGAAADGLESTLDYLDTQPDAIFGAVHACAALHDLDASFAILQGYYFGEGRWSKVAPAAGDEDRATNSLFLPPMRAAWADPRFAELVRRIGLEAYWRESGTVPDFRRGQVPGRPPRIHSLWHAHDGAIRHSR